MSAEVLRERLTTRDTIIHVDRSLSPMYPPWVEKVMYPELEHAGPAEYDIREVGLWLHNDQKNGGLVSGHLVYQHLKDTDMLKDCLGLRDFEEIHQIGAPLYREYFGDNVLFGWKSIVEGCSGGLLVTKVPYLCGGGRWVTMCWHRLGGGLSNLNPAGRFVRV